MVENISIRNLKLIFIFTAYYIKLLAPKHHNKTGFLSKKNRHILETARAFLIRAHMSIKYWDDVVATKVHLLNDIPSKS